MTAEHPSDATWERLALGELPVAERAAAIEHALGCPDCRRVYKALLALEEGARAFDPGVPGARPRGRRWIVAGSAALAIAAALAL
jgi:hypothetical protein